MALKKIYRFLGSVKLAVIVLILLAVSLAVATTLESAYDTATAQYFVYRSSWFFLLLSFLGVNIVFAAILRFPWKKQLAPFLLAHLGILIMLIGAFRTDRYGIDGNLRITEGETSGTVELPSSALFVTEGNTIRKFPISFVPTADRFRPIESGELGQDHPVLIDQYIPHAESDNSFIEDQGPRRSFAAPAIQLRIKGGPMAISQEFWLWGGDPLWSRQRLGPARFMLGGQFEAQQGHPGLHIEPRNPEISVHALSSDGKKKEFLISSEKIRNHTIDPGWKGGVQVTFLEWIPHATLLSRYRPSKQMYGEQAPPPAIHVTLGQGSEKNSVWLGLGDRTFFQLGKKEIELLFYPERVVLPFAIRLNRFAVQYYEGSHDPMSYSSDVAVVDSQGERPITISMNEPLQYRGYTLYQSSYEDAEPRPVTSVLSVNRDPGRIWKYLGSIFIVLGVILLFISRYKKRAAQEVKV